MFKYQDNANTVAVDGDEELGKLDDLSDAITIVAIRDVTEIIDPSRLPPHVRSLWLTDSSLVEGARFPERLEELGVYGLETDQDITLWELPTTLRRFCIRSPYGPVDLRHIKAPTIEVYRYGVERKILYPETLPELSYHGDHIDFADLPPALIKLDLRSTTRYSGVDRVLHTVESITVTGVQAPPRSIFPNLKSLRISDLYTKTLLVDWPELTALTITSPVVGSPVVIASPKLESMCLISDGPMNGIRIKANTGLGLSLKTITLEGQEEFPVDDDWGCLESVTLRGFRGELPQIMWLSELDTDQPVRTRTEGPDTVLVSNIDEYKAAWGFSSKAKSARY